jgi:hypothetical protein
MIGRYSELNNIAEVQDLQIGMDFRLPQYRREVFLRFYEHHLTYRSHPGAVYYVFPYIWEKHNFTQEQKLWFCYINGCSQHPITTWLIYEQFPCIHTLNVDELSKWFNANYKQLGWDTDRRYFKAKFVQDVAHYQQIVKASGMSQEDMFNSKKGDNAFDGVWHFIRDEFIHFGRLSTFSYMEYLNIAGLDAPCNDLMISDISGSKSHRNGLCKVLGRDDLDWTKNNPVKYDAELLGWLDKESHILLNEAQQRINHPDVGFYTLESTLCCFKGWFRVNRRYPNVYNDMFHDRIKASEANFGELPLFWDARAKYLPEHLRLEDTPSTMNLCKQKQNHFRITGEPVMMFEYDAFINNGHKKPKNLFS